MEHFTSNGLFILGLTLVIGWLLGLLSRSGSGKWKSAYTREHEAHVALRKEFDAHLRQHAVAAPVGTTETVPLRTGGILGILGYSGASRQRRAVSRSFAPLTALGRLDRCSAAFVPPARWWARQGLNL